MGSLDTDEATQVENQKIKTRKLKKENQRFRTDRAYNLQLITKDDCTAHGFPELDPVMALPDNLRGFNYALSTKESDKQNFGCHFYIDDYQFERVWSSPELYVDTLRGFNCVLTPDFSLYVDMPLPMQAWNHYRSMALGKYWQRMGITVVPTLSWSTEESYSFCFDGVPRNSCVSVSTVGVKQNKRSMELWRYGMVKAIIELEPRRILLYGENIDFDFGTCEVIRYKNSVVERVRNNFVAARKLENA